jgi:hypothetical protein
MNPRPSICKRESRIARHCVPVGALPPPCGRRCPCTSIRARGARRRLAVEQRIWLAEGACGRTTSVTWASRIAARQAEGNRRGEPVVSCGTPASEPALSTPPWCGQRSRPWAGAGMTIAVAQGRFAGSARHHRNPLRWPLFARFLLCRALADLDFQRAEIVSVSCPTPKSDKRGLGGFG